MNSEKTITATGANDLSERVQIATTRQDTKDGLGSITQNPQNALDQLLSAQKSYRQTLEEKLNRTAADFLNVMQLANSTYGQDMAAVIDLQDTAEKASVTLTAGLMRVELQMGENFKSRYGIECIAMQYAKRPMPVLSLYEIDLTQKNPKYEPTRDLNNDKFEFKSLEILGAMGVLVGGIVAAGSMPFAYLTGDWPGALDAGTIGLAIAAPGIAYFSLLGNPSPEKITKRSTLNDFAETSPEQETSLAVISELAKIPKYAEAAMKNYLDKKIETTKKAQDLLK